ncbi:mechanosensitive ion channel domain-containing protein [Phyllobacterium sp. TAF24]|uniref:mechanosensitive ion channel domain-containing protein n=1 Tax=Phyllobacterium sp. TAF24 TaxID=3233068 RepID=UPI003F9DF2EE
MTVLETVVPLNRCLGIAVVVFWVLFGSPVLLGAQTLSIPSVSTDIARLRDSLDGADLDETERKVAKTRLDEAARDEAVTADIMRAIGTKSDQFTDTIEYRNPTRSDAQQTLEAWRLQVEHAPDLVALEHLRDQARTEITELRSEADAVAGARSTLSIDALISTGEDVVSSYRQAVDDALRRRLDDTSFQADLLYVVSVAKLRRAIAGQQSKNRDLAAAPVRRVQLDLKYRDLANRLAVTEKRLGIVRERLVSLRSAQTTSIRSQLESGALSRVAPDSSQDRNPALAALAQKNLAYGGLLNDTDKALGFAEDAAESNAERARKVAAITQSVRARLAVNDNSAQALSLIQPTFDLDALSTITTRLREVRHQSNAARLQQIEIGEAWDSATEAMPVNANVLAGLPFDTPKLQSEAQQLLDARAKALPALMSLNAQLLTALSGQERSLKTQLQASTELEDLLERRLPWTPSHASIDENWVAGQSQGWGMLLPSLVYLKPSPLLWQALLRQWPLLLTVFLGLAFGMSVRIGLPRVLARYPSPSEHIADNNYRSTLVALICTFVAATPLTVLALGASWLIRGAEIPGEFGQLLPRMLQGMAPLLFVIGLIKPLTAVNGLAHRHFGWTQQNCEKIQRLRPFLWVLLAVEIGFALVFVPGQEASWDIAGRDLLLFWLGIAGFAVWRLLAVNRTNAGDAEGQGFNLGYFLLRLSLLGGIIFLLGLVVSGYLLTVITLISLIENSAFAVLFVCIVRGLLKRWFMLRELREARLEQRLLQTDVLRQERINIRGGSLEPGGTDARWQTLSEHSQRLLKAVTGMLLLAGFIWLWSGLFPALEWFDEVHIWGDAVTSKSVLLGSAALVLSLVAAQSLPGIVEIGLHARAGVDAPTRYAITSISRYVIIIGGLVTGLSLFGVRWDQLQWLVAALTVGLGFGLQEIFANFVSGLIILFERPLRVGDLVTIGEYTGTVSKIRARATTLVDADNKEVLVPNKSFITDRLSNWTLNDTSTRLVIKVSVAENTDISAVHRILCQSATEHALILARPPPRSFLVAFGASGGLDFELRVFVRSIEDRMNAINELNARIAEAFAKAGIHIANPQVGVHIDGVIALQPTPVIP